MDTSAALVTDGSSGIRAGGRQAGLRRALGDIERFSAAILKMPLRGYQAEIAQAILRAIAEGSGQQLTVLMPRQSGKNQITATCQRVSASVRLSPSQRGVLSAAVSLGRTTVRV